MIINGKFGSGKTTLLGFIEERCENSTEFNIVKYNAWEDNLFDNPIISILYEISKLENTEDKIKKYAQNIVKNMPKKILGTLANTFNEDLSSVFAHEKIFDEYDKYKEAIKDFRTLLTDYCKDKKLLFLIDELDRCLPEYQIKVLEAIYHLLEIPNLIVVIALDKEQLECSIKNKFGDAQNTLGYLAKFINYQIDLPDNKDSNFIVSLMYFNCQENSSVKQFIAELLKMMDYSVRDCLNIISEINLICNGIDGTEEKRNYNFWYPVLVALVLIIKTENNKIYKQYFSNIKENGYISDKIPLRESSYYSFLESIKGTKLQRVLDHLSGLQDYYLDERIIILYFINAFSPVKKIETKDLAHYLNTDEESINQLLSFSMRGVSYPETIISLMRKINGLSF